MSRVLQLLLAALALATVSAACTATAAGPSVASLDDPGASAASAPSASPLTPQDAALAYARCMRENGVDMPDPVVYDDGEGRVSINQVAGPGSVSKDDFLKAEEACRHHMNAAMPDAGPPLSAEDMDKMLAFAQCMREHGIAMEDPTADGGIRVRINDGTGSGGKGMPENDAELQAAHEACADLLPGKLGKPGMNTDGAKPGGGIESAPDAAGSN